MNDTDNRPGVCRYCGTAIEQPAVGRPRWYCNFACGERLRRESRGLTSRPVPAPNPAGDIGRREWTSREYWKLTGAERLQRRIRVDEITGCWEWLGAKDQHGYGHIGYRGRKTSAHRLMYEQTVGPIPDGLELDHLCKNPPCCNPAHLEAVTHAVNSLRSDSPMAKAARRDTCVHGHPYEGHNLIVEAGGARRCRTCHYAGQKRRRDAKRPQS